MPRQTCRLYRLPTATTKKTDWILAQYCNKLLERAVGRKRLPTSVSFFPGWGVTGKQAQLRLGAVKLLEVLLEEREYQTPRLVKRAGTVGQDETQEIVHALTSGTDGSSVLISHLGSCRTKCSKVGSGKYPRQGRHHVRPPTVCQT